MPVEFDHIPKESIDLITEVEVGGEKHVLQRKDVARAAKLAEKWDESLVGTLTIHRLLDHPTRPGVLHPGDGGTRWMAAPEGFMFLCTVEGVTIKESARRFLGVNKERKAVPKLDEYGVALTAGEEWAIAIHDALTANRLVADTFPRLPNGGPGAMAAIAACEHAVRVTAGYPELPSDWTVEKGGELLAALLGITLSAFDPGASMVNRGSTYGIDGDLIRAMSNLMKRNYSRFGQVRYMERLRDTLRGQTPEWWKSQSASLSANLGNTPGSAGRPAYLEHVIVSRYNSRLGEAARLKYPPISRSILRAA